jgi:hypothetical protein
MSSSASKSQCWTTHPRRSLRLVQLEQVAAIGWLPLHLLDGWLQFSWGCWRHDAVRHRRPWRSDRSVSVPALCRDHRPDDPREAEQAERPVCGEGFRITGRSQGDCRARCNGELLSVARNWALQRLVCVGRVWERIHACICWSEEGQLTLYLKLHRSEVWCVPVKKEIQTYPGWPKLTSASAARVGKTNNDKRCSGRNPCDACL